MFEKSLVDLIRGLRGHKGNENEYIQSALKECRNEIRSQDMDVKATALLKLIYLEMFGYDLSWAAFNILEVMASSQQLQKRVGYLAAVQTFRPDTEVLMLAENLLKKDLASPSIPVLTLPLVTLPHVVTSSLALSILSDLLPRLSHSQPTVRKKTIVTLYRLALVYPETLRVAWPKIKERLLDEQEDSSVTAATVNVVCELGWRRPQDFLALAPRLFDLLVSDKNNWMAIKIIKLFAVLTPLEPRLIKKLVRPLTKILQETTAMSLLYECINGIIQGGILDGTDSGINVEDVADLCISKLRGMIVLEGDPNLKYVALLAFNKIVTSHPMLVSMQQDVIMACLDDPDISIKMQALELVSGMINKDNVQAVVDRLLKQLANAPKEKVNGMSTEFPSSEDNTDLEQKLVADKRGLDAAPIPDDYRYEIVSRILDMCSINTYSNITDFEWYIETLVHLVRHLPPNKSDLIKSQERLVASNERVSLGSRIGTQVLDITIRVKELRPESTKAAETLLLISNRSVVYASHGGGQDEILKSAAWICGEFSQLLTSPYEVLNSLVHESSHTLPAITLSIYIQSLAKVVARLAATANRDWNASRATTLSLALARTIDFLEKLSEHPNLEVQERAVEFLELLKLASEALNSQAKDSLEAPLFLTSAIPNLFSSLELNPVAMAAQKKVPYPDDLDLDSPINPNLNSILQASQVADSEDVSDSAFHIFYYEREPISMTTNIQPPQISRTPDLADSEPTSYQSAPESPATRARRRAERMARNKDDPFYIPAPGSEQSSGRTSPFQAIYNRTEGLGDDLDIDSIPIIDLQINSNQMMHQRPQTNVMQTESRKHKKKPPRSFVIAADETIGDSSSTKDRDLNSGSATPTHAPSLVSSTQPTSKTGRPTKNLLSVDSSGLGSVSLEGRSETETTLDFERREAEEAEMAAALREVELKRLEMQREIERSRTALAEGVDVEGTIVKRKKKKKKANTPKDTEEITNLEDQNTQGDGPDEVIKRRKRKRKKTTPADGIDASIGSSTMNAAGTDFVEKQQE